MNINYYKAVYTVISYNNNGVVKSQSLHFRGILLSPPLPLNSIPKYYQTLVSHMTNFSKKKKASQNKLGRSKPPALLVIPVRVWRKVNYRRTQRVVIEQHFLSYCKQPGRSCKSGHSFPFSIP